MPAAQGLPAEGLAAREALASALVAPKAEAVSQAARGASAWQGQDPALDRLLGDALANVLMRPEEGLPLLEANPAPDDPAWRRALRGAALRSDDKARIAAAWTATGGEPPQLDVPLLSQIVSRARHDPAFDVGTVDALLWRCALLLRRPTVGRKSLGMQVEGDLFAAGRALGASGFAVGRSVLQVDMSANAQVWRCGELVLLEDEALPSPLPPRVTVLGATDGKVDVYLELREEEGVPVVFVASNGQWGARWMRAASLLAQGPTPEQGLARVRETLGSGLAGTAFPQPAP